MARKPNGTLSWEVDEIAKVFKISRADVREYFTDGRRVSFIIERRMAREILKGQLADSEGDEFDIIDSSGRKWEVRSISEGGIYFCPSYMVGSGRKFDKNGFMSKIKRIDGYIITDIVSFPDMPFWVIKKEIVLDWWKRKELGTTTKISRQKILKLIENL